MSFPNYRPSIKSLQIGLVKQGIHISDMMLNWSLKRRQSFYDYLDIAAHNFYFINKELKKNENGRSILTVVVSIYRHRFTVDLPN